MRDHFSDSERERREHSASMRLSDSHRISPSIGRLSKSQWRRRREGALVVENCWVWFRNRLVTFELFHILRRFFADRVLLLGNNRILPNRCSLCLWHTSWFWCDVQGMILNNQPAQFLSSGSQSISQSIISLSFFVPVHGDWSLSVEPASMTLMWLLLLFISSSLAFVTDNSVEINRSSQVKHVSRSISSPTASIALGNLTQSDPSPRWSSSTPDSPRSYRDRIVYLYSAVVVFILASAFFECYKRYWKK